MVALKLHAPFIECKVVVKDFPSLRHGLSTKQHGVSSKRYGFPYLSHHFIDWIAYICIYDVYIYIYV